MPRNLQTLYDEIQKVTPFFAVEGDVLPVSSPSQRVLYVNCACEPVYAQGLPEDLLQRCRADASEAIQTIKQATNHFDYNLDGLCVSIYQSVENSQNIRIYRVDMTIEQLLDFDESRYIESVYSERSHLDSINELLTGSSD